MFEFQGGESACHAQGELRAGCATRIALSNQPRLLIDQNQGAVLRNDQNALDRAKRQFDAWGKQF